MPRYAYERLSAQDASFLLAEGPNQPMHVGGLAVLEAGPLRLAEGGVDIERFRRAVEGVLHWIPRYRQKIAWTPLEGWPIWVDDRHFELGYHIRHIALPSPGRMDQLKELAARIHSRPLDRRHALWEIWVIEGVEGGTQFALLNKIHHCMIDGAAGADLSQILMSPLPNPEANEPLPYMPRPEPTASELLRDAIAVAVSRPLGLLRDFAFSSTSNEPEPEAPAKQPGPTLGQRLGALKDLLGYMLRPAPETPINGTLSPHRRLDWLTMPLDDVLELRRVFECTVNDVVLATVAGAMRRYLFRRRVDYREIDFRVAAPVSTRSADDDRRQGNHVSSWIVELPLALEDPAERLAAVHRATVELKNSEAALAVDSVMKLAEWLPAPLIARGVGLAQGPANMIVTNVPGPQFPLYMVGARLLGLYPLVPLLPGGGLGVALFSYEGKLCWGFSGDQELVPDLGAVVDDVRAAFEELRGAAVSRYMDRRTAEVEAPVSQGPALEAAVEAKTEDRDVSAQEATIEVSDEPARRRLRAVSEIEQRVAPVADDGPLLEGAGANARR